MMMDICTRNRKVFAGVFLVIFSLQTIVPGTAYALTSGPSQPEMQKFEPAGTSNMVDLFTGDFKYNIPLLDVGGYPINLSYQSGTGMEDEASWVGMGWTLNPGAVNRTMRGLPDDFNGGEDKITKIYKRKPKKKVGATITFKPSILGWEVGAPAYKMNIYKDNYYGVGASMGVSLGYSVALNRSGSLTAGLKADITSDSRNGVDLSPTLSMDVTYEDYLEKTTAGLSGSFAYNTRQGLKSSTLGASFSSNRTIYNQPVNLDMSATHYYGESYQPSIPVNTVSSSYSLSIDGGVTLFGVYAGVGGSGYTYNESVEQPETVTPAYGYMHHLTSRGNLGVLQDFNREKDGVFLQTTPALAMPVATHDLFMATGQSGSIQFRPHLAGPFVAYDKKSTISNTSVSGGITLGAGNLVLAGGRLQAVDGSATTQKWVRDNWFLTAAEPQFNAAASLPVYMKAVGEQTQIDAAYLGKILDDKTVKVPVSNDAAMMSLFADGDNVSTGVSNLKKGDGIEDRDKRTNLVTYLTAKQANRFGLDKKIVSYSTPLSRELEWAPYGISNEENPVAQPDHISEIQVTGKDGQRSVYGIPVYNMQHKECTFSVAYQDNNETARRKGLAKYTVSSDNLPVHNKGRDELLNVEKTSDYTTSYLLTGVLSPDYVDITGDGISDDDKGSAIKFKYRRTCPDFKWRSPMALKDGTNMMANYNEGFLSDPKDDKASYVYGEKDLWFLLSVESKTMIAVFELGDRDDAKGVTDEHAQALSGNGYQKKLSKIRLYSKAEYLANPATAVPIKTVHFQYGYGLYPGSPNSTATGGGRLTLEKVWFTFGTNQRASSNPYEFTYDTRLIKDNISGLPAATDDEASDNYFYRQTDRWGTYKKSFYNRVANGARVLNNSEFPYTIQDNDVTPWSERDLQNKLVSKWQLVEIVTPPGNKITVEYESDDYGYVQNRKAMQMCFIRGITTEGNNTGLIDALKLIVELPVTPASNDDFKKRYLDGVKQMFFKVFTDLDNKGHREFVHGYAEVDAEHSEYKSGNTATIVLKPMNEVNPIAKAGWQMLQTDLPQYAYDGYDNTDVGDGAAAIRSIIQALGNLKELVQPFSSRAKSRGYANTIDLNRSMVRLVSPKGEKMGGGARVRKISISDEWKSMTGNLNDKTSVYGQVFSYRTIDKDGQEISSGVASYEPQSGNEENPFHEPVNYTEKVHWSSDRYHYMEKPFCETWFPAPQVGYSKVKITDFGADNNNSTGYTEHCFYTAKDFPTLVDYTTLDQQNYQNSMILQLFSSVVTKRLAATQGFKVELNDMHGKQKSVSVFNKAGAKISSTEYFYNVKDETAEVKQLDNKVNTLKKDGNVESKMLATDVDFMIDARQSINEDLGASVGTYAGSLLGLFLAIPYTSFRITPSNTTISFRSEAAVKVINRYGLIKRIRTMQDGSVMDVENMIWDGETGEALLTRKQNEFDNNIYSFTYPAWMVKDYEGMAGAYKNAGTILKGVASLESGIINNTLLTPFLFPGDELIPITEGDKKLWVVKPEGQNDLMLIYESGEPAAVFSGDYLIARSGRRNLAGAGVATVITMSNPVVNGKLSPGVDKRVLDAKVTEYSNEWNVPFANRRLPKARGTDPCHVDAQCLEELLQRLIMRPALTDPAARSISSGSPVGGTYLFDVNVNPNIQLPTCWKNKDYAGNYNGIGEQDLTYYVEQPHSTTISGNKYYYLQAGDVAHLNDATIVFNEVSPQFNELLRASNTLNSYSEIGYEYSSTATHRFVKKYCLIKESDCSYLFKRLDNFVFPSNVLQYPESCAPVNTPYGTTVPLLRFSFTPAIQYECRNPVGEVMNPYVEGVLGNWRPKSTSLYAVNRVQRQSQSTIPSSTDIRNAGYYSTYNPYWDFTGEGLIKNTADAEKRWLWNAESIFFDEKGNEIESASPISQFNDKNQQVNDDPSKLKMYNTALFGYQQSLSVAVAANARHNEIMYDGFEDYKFGLPTSSVCPVNRHFDWQIANNNGNYCSSSGCITTEKAHSGRYSYKLASMVNLTRSGGRAHPVTSKPYIVDNMYRYVVGENELANGFAPVPGKKYLLSMWVNDDNPESGKISKINVTVNNTDFPAATTKVPVVEGWKKLELVFTAGTNFSLFMGISGTVYIDDVRIQPYDGEIKTFAYDDRTLRLMAQLDENNYATYYEYDEEGTPVRVKKETERGVMTLKENRQFLRKR